jgi:triphosphoribosyl-dephospho-CoA synthase
MTADVAPCAQLACIWEATARKPGNVHRYRDFADLSYVDFLASAAAIAPILASARGRRIGATVLDCVRATTQVAPTNSNLGIVLLLAPLAAVPMNEDLRSGIGPILSSLDVEDSRLTYEAIRLANPGGLGNVPEQDVATEPTQSLGQVMTLAADRDIVARQYANGYRQVFNDGVATLASGIASTGSLEGAIIRTHLVLMARHPDTLIARKCGPAVAAEASRWAARVLAAGWPERDSGREEMAKFDTWLRADGHRRNPGASADVLTAALFVLLREGTIQTPLTVPWSLGATFL